MPVQISIGKSLGVEGAPEQTQIDALCRPIADYHRALTNRDNELLGQSVCEIVYRVYATPSAPFAEWEPWPRLTREQILRNFSSAFADSAFYYENEVEFTHVKLNGEEAFVRTVESGRTWKDKNWERVEVLWHVTPASDGRWQIAGHIYHLP